MERSWWPGPVILAVLITSLNSVKPAVVDDTAYLLFAQQISTHPLDPYGFEIFWYSQPEPAMRVLLPPVLPYWLALGIALFGNNLVLLKLWLLPFILTFCLAVAFLLRRLARGVEGPALVLLVGSPFILPFVSVMLDIPAIALGLGGVAVFIHGCDRRSWVLAVAAGILAALAIQTKYTMMVIPVVFAWYGLLNRSIGLAVAAGAVAVCVFVGWELFLEHTYGTSHFLFHLQDQRLAGNHSGFEGWIGQKFALGRPLVGFLGGLAVAWGLAAARLVGWPRWLVGAIAVTAVVGILAVCLIEVPDSRTQRSSYVDPSITIFYSLGTFTLVAGLCTAIALVIRFRRGTAGWIRRNRDSWFLVGWFFIELGAYFALTPFPAGRRVIAVCILLAFIVSRLWSRARPVRLPGRWIILFGLACGLGLFALDSWDAQAEKILVEQSAEVIQSTGDGQIWTQGHWGWQFYAEQQGWRLVVPGQSKLKAGDWLVVPVPNEPTDFYRPHHGFATFDIPPDAVELVRELSWGDGLPARTIPTLYGGVVPVVGRGGPRLQVAIYRVRSDWIPLPS